MQIFQVQSLGQNYKGEVSLFLEVPKLSVSTQHNVEYVESSLYAKTELDLFGSFDITLTCDRQTQDYS